MVGTWPANKAVQATAAAPRVFDGPGDSLLLGFVVAPSRAAVPDLVRSAAEATGLTA